MYPKNDPIEETILDRLMYTAPSVEIWWDSSPLVYRSWANGLIAKYPEEQREKLTRQLQRLYDPENPAATRFTGVTTNPPLSYQAIQDDPARWSVWVTDYASQHPDQEPAQVGWELYKEIVRLGAQMYLPVYQRTDYCYGQLSAQVNPYTFFDADQMVKQALELRKLSENIAIKIPGSREGVEAIQRLTALGVPTNCTSGYIVSQFIAVAEAVQAGLLEARQNGIDLTGWRSVITFMSARWEGAPEFGEQAKQAGVELSVEDQRWASVAVFKNAYRIFRQRAYPSKLLICSLRLGPVVNGELRCWHVEELAGSRAVFTLPPPFLNDLFLKLAHLKFEPRIRNELPAEVMARLRKVPYFVEGYEPDGLTAAEFNQIPALLSTKKEFCAALDKIVAFAAQAMPATQAEALPA
jgi:transaldolase